MSGTSREFCIVRKALSEWNEFKEINKLTREALITQQNEANELEGEAYQTRQPGSVLNNINTRLDARTISVLLQHSESKLVFVDYYRRSTVLEAICLFPDGLTTPLLVLITDHHTTNDADYDLSVLGFRDTYEGLVEKGSVHELE
ncbi:hypothetical protein ACH5RR_021752 [Cinchona calisaya]|uniref:Uncharacterized protein n=1 Tax=Cinchona calisaya TaxID=153742 RepID=A0ABD2ZIH3_9GENT